MSKVDMKILAAGMISDMYSGAISDISKIECNPNSEENSIIFKKMMNFYLNLANELNNKIKEAHPSFAIKGLRELINNFKPRKSHTRKRIMNGGVGTHIVKFTNTTGNPGQIVLYNQGQIQTKYGIEAGILINRAHAAAKKGDLLAAMELASVVDDMVKAEDELERALPFASEVLWSTGGLLIGAMLGVSIFYLGIAGILVPAGLAAGTAQYAANLATNTSRKVGSTLSWGYVKTDVAQPDAINTAKAVSKNLQELIESVISDRMAISYMAICAVGCMILAYLYARKLNISVFTARRGMNGMRNARKQTIRHRAREVLTAEEHDKRASNLETLGLNETATNANIKSRWVALGRAAREIDATAENRNAYSKANSAYKRLKKKPVAAAPAAAAPAAAAPAAAPGAAGTGLG